MAAVAPPIMRHRLLPSFAAQSEGITSDDIVKKLLEAVPQNAAPQRAAVAVK